MWAMARNVSLRIFGIRPYGKIIYDVNKRTGGYRLKNESVWYEQELRVRILDILREFYNFPYDFKPISRPFRMGVFFCVRGRTHFDFTNLVKAVEDACNGLLFEDDSLRKGTCLPDGIMEGAPTDAILIRVEEMDAPLHLPVENFEDAAVEVVA